MVAVGAETSQELYDVMGHQRGWEIIGEGVGESLLTFPPFRDFALALARDAAELAAAPALPTSEREVVVVTDPHYNTLVSHEIVGHPAELDRALKMETAYAGRSWLLADLEAHQVGRRIASPLVTAYSDPALPGYGHYAYDHEGTPARRVTHIDRGIFRGFMNSRQTAAVFGGQPNGHFKATDAALVPLVRMSTTVFAGHSEPPITHGYDTTITAFSPASRNSKVSLGEPRSYRSRSVRITSSDCDSPTRPARTSATRRSDRESP